jgi:hypothetical protein
VPDFPITGNYRVLLLTLEILSIAIFMEIGFFFLRKYYHNKKTSYTNVVHFAWAVLSLSYAISWIFYIIGDYYGHRDTYLFVGYISLCIGALVFSYQIESKKLVKTKYLFTIFAIAVFSSLILSMIFFPDWTQTIASLASIPAFGIILVYFYTLIKTVWNTYKISSIGLITGILCWIIGYSGTTDTAVSLFGGFYIRALSDFLVIIGLIILGFSLKIIPSVDEFLWQENLKYIILTTKWGVCVYNQNYREKRELNEVLLSGALAAVREFLKDTLDKESGLKVVSKGEEYYLIEEGEYIVGILIVKKELRILKIYLKRIIREFESFFRESLVNWSGNIETFAPTKDLINNIMVIEK